MSNKKNFWCMVPLCKNTSTSTPNKLFISVPLKENLRNKWFTLAKRDPTQLSAKSHVYFCEDHFDLPNDMENYMQYKIMGSVKKVKIKPDCFPSKFECQPIPPKRAIPCSCKLGGIKKQKIGVCDSSDTKCQNEFQLQTAKQKNTGSTNPCNKIVESSAVFITEFVGCDSELPLRVDIKGEPNIDIKEEPILRYEDDSIKKETLIDSEENNIDLEIASECIELGNYVITELKKLKDYNSLSVARQCIKSIISAAQNGVYRNGVVPTILPIPTDSVVKDEPIDQ